MEPKPHPRIIDMTRAMADAMTPERPPVPNDENRPADADEGANRAVEREER